MIFKLSGRQVLRDHIGAQEAEIARLKIRIAELEKDVQESVTMLLALGEEPMAQSMASAGSGSTRDCILAILADSDRAWKLNELCAEIDDRFGRPVKANSVSVELGRMRGDGMIFRADKHNLWFRTAELAKAYVVR